MAVISKTWRHDIHGAMGTDPGKHLNLVVLVANDDKWFTKGIDIDEIADVLNLRYVGKAEPVVFEKVVYLPVKERFIGISLGRECGALLKRQVGDALNLCEDFIDGEVGLASGDSAAFVGVAW